MIDSGHSSTRLFDEKTKDWEQFYWGRNKVCRYLGRTGHARVVCGLNRASPLETGKFEQADNVCNIISMKD